MALQPLVMWQALYDLATWLAQPLVRRKLRLRGRAEAGYLQAVPERFGDYASSPARPVPVQGAPRVWIHAVSLGETRAAAILLDALRAQWPGMRLLLTNGTATGRAEGERLLRPGDVQVWQPWDTHAATRRFMQHYRPDLGVLLETEVWPNLMRACRAEGVPVVLANARLSQQSLQGALRVRGIMRPAYESLSAAWAQTEEDARRLRELGAPVAGMMGNLKFDVQPSAGLLALGRAWRASAGRPVVMLASSRAGEEEEFFARIAQLPRSGAGVQWLVVPRHPQRFDEVALLAQQQGLSVSRRSQWHEMPQPADVWLGDSLGEMHAYYALAEVALLGGSFAPLGGQNLIEAAACGCPVVMGPHTFNFAEAAEQALAAGAALRVSDLQHGIEGAVALARDAAGQSRMADAARAFARQHQGAARRLAEALQQWVPVSGPDRAI